MSGSAPIEGPEAVAAIVPLDDDARRRLEVYAALLRRWQPVKNLVAPSTLDTLWTRHMADSAEAHAALPEAVRWLDLGSGAGFPGLVTAILIAGRPNAEVTLVESNGRKAAFLMTVARELALPARVIGDRIESVAERFASLGPVEAVSARALASLDRLFGYAEPWLAAGSRAVFHKGRDFAAERDVASHAWSFDLLEVASRIEADARIVVASNVRRNRLPDRTAQGSERP